MQSTYYQNTGAMVTQFNRLDTITNNLANVNTNGYKKQDVVIGDFKRLYDEAKSELPINNHTKDGARYYNATVTRTPQVVEGYENKEVGAMKQTSNPFDFALADKDLYFAVQTPEGIKLTRDGSFTLNGDGVLVNKSGHPVVPANFRQNDQPLQFEQDQVINVDKDGTIYSRAADEMDGEFEQIGALLVARHDNQNLLEKEGDNLYKLDNPDNLRISQNSGGVVQGMVEMSNVNAVREMTGLIETQRLVQMYQKVMDTHMNDLNQDAITKLATIKA
ncbi:MAG: flagellar hook-basal body protein [Campylobacterota bacterium]